MKKILLSLSIILTSQFAYGHQGHHSPSESESWIQAALQWFQHMLQSQHHILEIFSVLAVLMTINAVIHLRKLSLKKAKAARG